MIRSVANRAARLGEMARLLGVGWVAFRLRQLGRERLGLLERASPMDPWPPTQGLGRPEGLPLSPEFLRSWLAKNYSVAQHEDLRQRVARLKSGEFPVFGEWLSPRGWHHDPIGDVQYHRDAHWTKVKVPAHADVKRVWEPSRFSWSFDLVRSHLLDPADGAADRFWWLIDDWMVNNPPNAGVNWACGQEASMRLLAAAIAAEMMPDALSDDRRNTLQQLALITGRRVEANIEYARSQRNNHHLSEAVGLLTAAYLCPGSEHAERWRSLGVRHATEVAEQLIFADGGSSQYSVNYHRVFLHDLCGLQLVLDGLGEQMPGVIRAAFERATEFMVAIIEPYSGCAPAIGQDDGANLLPWSASPHRYMRPDADLCLTVLGRPSICVRVEDQEPAAWLGRDRPLGGAPTSEGASARQFPQFGLVVLTVDPWTVYFRVGNTSFRPSQDDQMHCDIWRAGENVAYDPGTHTYHPAPGEPGDLGEACFHNTIRGADSQTNMRRLSKFMWGGQPTTEVEVDPAAEQVESCATARWPDGRVDRRKISVQHDGVTVTDESSSAFVTHWNVIDNAHVATEPPAEAIVSVVAAQYGQYAEASAVEVRGERRVITRFSRVADENNRR